MSAWEQATGNSDEWYTPLWVFTALGCEFDLDVAAPIKGPPYVPCKRWIYKDSLTEKWDGFIWMNPPYGGRGALAIWLGKFCAHANGIALVPDRTSAPWFQQSAELADAILFTKRISFLKPDGTTGVAPPNGSALLAIGEPAVAGLIRARDSGAGFLVTPNPRKKTLLL